MAVDRPFGSLKLSAWSLVCLCLFVALGCKKGDDGTTPTATATVVALTGDDIKKDGTLSDQGLKAIDAQSSKPDVTLSFLRSKISDGALAQVAKYSNVHRIEAIGSPITDQAIAKLKTTNPNVVIVK